MKQFGIITFLIVILVQCTKDKAPASVDLILYQKARDTLNMTWFAYSDDFLPKSSGSSHAFPLLRTRYNSTAAAMLDSSGKVRENAQFPEGSLIVKELVNADHSLGRYAILYKQPQHESADPNGWIWGYINADGTVYTTATDKGISCTGCHSQAGNMDYMLMNKYFP